MSTDPKHVAATPKQADSSQDVEFSAAEFEALLNAAIDGIIVTDRDGRILRMNAAAESMFGLAAADVGSGSPFRPARRHRRQHE